MQMILSAIDIKWPGNLNLLVPALEKFGYYRFWTTEHHSPFQSGSPLVAAAILCGFTEKIRIGSAGVLLHYTSPLQVLESFRLLEMFYPGRLDMGIAGATVDDLNLHLQLLDGRSKSDKQTYNSSLRKLQKLLEISVLDSRNGVESGTIAGPCESSLPEFWICGSSLQSSVLAGELGASYAFHEYIARQYPDGGPGPTAITEYRKNFIPNSVQSVPKCNVAVYGACAKSDADAARYWQSLFGISAESPQLNLRFTSDSIPKPSFLGSVSRCKDQLLQISEAYGVNELVVQCIAPDIKETIRSYRMLADEIL